MAEWQARPITQRIPPKRQDVARHYGVHPYFTRRPWNVVHAYIAHFCPKGGTVLDPFGGSGVTAIEALVLRRRAVQIDLNPLANFIASQIAVSPVNLAELTAAFQRLADFSKPYLRNWKKKSDGFFEENEPPFWYPKGVRLPKNADAEFVEDLFTRKQLFVLSLIHQGIQSEPDPRSRDLLRFCFSGTLAKTNRTFISARKRAATRGGPTIFSVYRYNIPKEPVELDPWEQFSSRFNNLVACKRETNKLIGDFYSPERCRFITGSATELVRFCPPHSVDYVFTDPPYGAHIAYLDLSTMWNAWLGFAVTEADKKEEIIEGGDLEHSRNHYLSALCRTIAQLDKVLKPGAWLSLVFEHRDSRLYSAIVEAAESAGLKYVNTVSQSLDVVWSMHKKKNRMNVLSGELILNFRRTASRRQARPKAGTIDVRNVIKEVAKHEIKSHKGASTETIFNQLMVRLIDSGQISHHAITLEELLGHLTTSGFAYDDASGRWYLHNKPSDAQMALSFD